MLNLAELGIGAAISFTLYKPLFEQNMEQINDVISVFGYRYREIGLFILFIAIAISPVLMLVYTIFTQGMKDFTIRVCNLVKRR